MYSYCVSKTSAASASISTKGLIGDLRMDLRGTGEYLEGPRSRWMALFDFLMSVEIYHHFEVCVVRTWGIWEPALDERYDECDAMTVLHVYNDEDAFAIRMFHDFLPMPADWWEQFQQEGHSDWRKGPPKSQPILTLPFDEKFVGPPDLRCHATETL